MPRKFKTDLPQGYLETLMQVADSQGEPEPGLLAALVDTGHLRINGKTWDLTGAGLRRVAQERKRRATA